MFESIYKVLNASYDHEQEDIPRSKAFAKEIKKYVAKQVKPYGYKVLKVSGYCSPTGFITDENGHYVYFAIGDYRWEDWENSVLIRTAEHEKDFRGGNNHFCDLAKIGEEVHNLMKQYIRWENR